MTEQQIIDFTTKLIELKFDFDTLKVETKRNPGFQVKDMKCIEITVSDGKGNKCTIDVSKK